MKWLTRITIMVVVLGILVVAALLVWPNKPAIPQAIKSQLTSTLLVPIGNGYSGAHDSAKYDSAQKLLSYHIQIAGVTGVTVSEQPAPSQFNDISGYYSQFVDDLGEYESFGTPNGTVNLIHPKNAPKSQAAVLYADGTLMFVKPDKNLSDSQWRAFFGALQVVR